MILIDESSEEDVMSIVELFEGGPEEEVVGQEPEDVSEFIVASVDEGGLEEEDVDDDRLGGGVGGMTKVWGVGGVSEDEFSAIPSSG